MAASASIATASSFVARLEKFKKEHPKKYRRLDKFQRVGGTKVPFTKELFEMLELKDTRVVNGLDLGNLLHGPKYTIPDDDFDYLATVAAHNRNKINGTAMHDWDRWQEEAAASDPYYRENRWIVNMVFPDLVLAERGMPYITNCVLLAHPDDCERVARLHVKKSPLFSALGLFGSVISTTDNEHWRKQRAHLAPVFLPDASLKKIFPITAARAAKCARRLDSLNAEAGKYGVQMNEFFLHEAMAQLQLGLMGLDEDFMEQTNKKIRDVFSGHNPDPHYGRDVVLQMMQKVGDNPDYAVATDESVIRGEKPIFGPLSKSVADAGASLGMNFMDQWGNMMIILFAGHDTTAHTMTWFTYEMSRHPQYQTRVQTEVDALFARMKSEGREFMEYADCALLPFMTRCIMETLRLWGPVPNGTFRELQFDEQVHGPGGKMVTLPEGTFVQIQSWSRHRSTKLWGPDAGVFNPDRAFKGNEVWGEHGACAYAGTNPSSPRFSPFTFAPRDCIGKNFAQMEMRAILANVFRRWHFTCSEPYRSPSVPVEMSLGTMGPRDLTPEGLAEGVRRQEMGQQPPLGMFVHLHRRLLDGPSSASRL